MSVYRLQLKPSSIETISYVDVLNYCISNRIIGCGWVRVTETFEKDWDLRDYIHIIYNESSEKDKTSAYKAIKAIKNLQEGDLIWTRLGGDGSQYYLCRVGKKLWKDRIVDQQHINYDLAQYVEADWLYIGKEDKVPGKVINSFGPRATIQHVRDVEEISKYIWNLNCDKEELKYSETSDYDFWTCIGSEDLESLVLMYLQYMGYYIISTTLKHSTAKFEAVMLSHDGKTKCYQQVKRSTPLKVEEWGSYVKDDEIMYLFTTSENYGSEKQDNVICITKNEIEQFMRQHPELITENVKYWLNITNFVY